MTSLFPNLTRFVVLAAALTFLGCTPDDRCGDDFDYNADDGVCVPLADTETECPVDTDSDTGDGLGDVCDNGCNQCDGDASYCLIDISVGDTDGYCTYQDCEDTPADTCPDGYTCCTEFQFGGMSFCVVDADFPELAGFCGGGK